MLDNSLHRDLVRLSGRATAAATPVPAEAIAGRGRRRRRARRLATGALVAIVAAGLVVGIIASRSPAHQRVSVRGGHVARPTVPAIGPATMQLRVFGELRRCTVVDNPVTSAADAPQRGALRADPISVTAVWIPALATNNVCRSTVTTADTGAATGLLTTIEGAAKPKPGLATCPMATINPGSVDLVFSYAQGRPWALVALSLGNCGTAVLPGHLTRDTNLSLRTLHPPAWVKRNLLGAPPLRTGKPLRLPGRSTSSGSK